MGIGFMPEEWVQVYDGKRYWWMPWYVLLELREMGARAIADEYQGKVLI